MSENASDSDNTSKPAPDAAKPKGARKASKKATSNRCQHRHVSQKPLGRGMNGQPFTTSLRFDLLQQRGCLIIEQSSWRLDNRYQSQELRRVSDRYWLKGATRLELKGNSCRRIHLLIKRNTDRITDNRNLCHAR